MNKLSCFFVICIFTTALSINLKTQNTLELNTTPVAPNVFITVDNILTEILVNGASVLNKSDPNLSDWTKVSSLSFPLKVGDVIVVKGSNIGSPSTGNPQGMLFSFYFNDQFGHQNLVNSSLDWTCDGRKAKSSGFNGVGPWGNFSAIDQNAQWIWNDGDYLDKATWNASCTYTIPPPPVVGPSNVCITCDNVVDDFKVNGVSVLPKNVNFSNWQLTECFYADIRVWDEIEVVSHNQGNYSGANPAACLFQIGYTDEYQKNPKTLVSSGGWWCNKKPAGTYGANGVSPWGKRPNISVAATWIWDVDPKVGSATCGYTISEDSGETCK